MAMAGVEVFDKTMQQTEMWVSDVARELGWDDNHKTFLGLRATLQTLRDRLTLGEAANLGSQLPILLAGFYYEGWKPESTPKKARTKEEFLNQVRSKLSNYFRNNDTDIDVEQLVRAVFYVISTRISTGEVEDITSILSTQLKELWPEEVRA
jgi:uncharacterized protein (DUF2267 family)